MAVAALLRIIRPHRRPDTFGEGEAMLFEFFRGIHRAQNLVQQLVRGLDLSPRLMEPVVGNVTVGASGADARSVPEVNGLLQFFVNVIPHFVAGNAELLGIGELHRPVETAPEDYAADTASDEHRGERKPRSWRPKKGPDTRNQSFPGFRCTSIAHVCPALVTIIASRFFRARHKDIAEKQSGCLMQSKL